MVNGFQEGEKKWKLKWGCKGAASSTDTRRCASWQLFMRFDCCVGYSWGNNRLHFCLGPHSLGPAALCTNCLLSLGQPGQPGRGVSTWNDCTRKGEHAGSDWSQGQTAQVTSKPQWKVKLNKKKSTKAVRCLSTRLCFLLCYTGRSQVRSHRLAS